MRQGSALPYMNRSLRRAFSILEAFLERGGKPMTLPEIVRAVGLNRTTVWRLVLCLEELGYVERQADDRFRLGLKLLRLGAVVQGTLDLRAAARPAMEALASATDESVYLSVRTGDLRVCIDMVESKQSIRHRIALGEAIALYAGAAGKLLLAFMPPDEVRKYLERVKLEPICRQTIQDPMVLLAQLEQIRREELAFSVEERFLDTLSIAAPVRDHSGNVIAALSITGPSVRMESRGTDKLAQEVRSAALDISKALGHMRTGSQEAEKPACRTAP